MDIADYLSAEDLRKHYEPHGVDISRIEEVDFVLTSRGLAGDYSFAHPRSS